MYIKLVQVTHLHIENVSILYIPGCAEQNGYSKYYVIITRKIIQENRFTEFWENTRMR